MDSILEQLRDIARKRAQVEADMRANSEQFAKALDRQMRETMNAYRRDLQQQAFVGQMSGGLGSPIPPLGLGQMLGNQNNPMTASQIQQLAQRYQPQGPQVQGPRPAGLVPSLYGRASQPRQEPKPEPPSDGYNLKPVGGGV